jgi:small conductance mechanosensitive channel
MTISSEVWTQIWQTALVVVVAVVVWVVARWLIHRWSGRIQKRLEATGELANRARAQRLGTIARSLVAITFVVAAAVAIVTVLGIWGVPLGPLIASLSVVGIAIGIGAQDLVKDVIAGMFVLIEDQYALGDVVQLAGVSGTVEEIRFSATWTAASTMCRTERSASRRT